MNKLSHFISLLGLLFLYSCLHVRGTNHLYDPVVNRLSDPRVREGLSQVHTIYLKGFSYIKPILDSAGFNVIVKKVHPTRCQLYVIIVEKLVYLEEQKDIIL